MHGQRNIGKKNSFHVYDILSYQGTVKRKALFEREVLEDKQKQVACLRQLNDSRNISNSLKTMNNYFSSQCSSISAISLLFRWFQCFAHLTFRLDQHVNEHVNGDEYGALVERH
jgi:hypothetical protein